MPALADVLPKLPWPDPVVPDYRTFALGRWKVIKTPLKGSVPGYWSMVDKLLPGYALQRRERGKFKTWMSLTPMELQSHQPHIAEASGRVVVIGLGMGMALYNFLLNPNVESILVIEKDQQVIDLFDRIVDWKRWPNASCISIVCADALKHTLRSPVATDFLYIDIWEKLAETTANLEATRICERYLPRKVGYWGQEFDYVTYLRQIGKDFMDGPTDADFEAFCAHSNMNLTGRRMPGYERFARAAVALQTMASTAASDPATANRLLLANLRLLGAFDRAETIQLDPGTQTA